MLEPRDLTDRIELHGIRAFGYHGVLASERAAGQEFCVDVTMHVDTRPAAAADDLSLTRNYAEVAQQVADIISADPADLIETVAERIAAAVLAGGAGAVDVAVHKPSAPIAVPFADVVVRIHRSLEHPPAVDPPRFVSAASSTAEPELAAREAEEELAAAEPEVAAEVAPEVAPALAEPDAGQGPSALGGTTVMPAELIAAAHAYDEAADAEPVAPLAAVIALGANLGDATATLKAAVGKIAALPGTRLVAISPLARSAAVGGPADQPDYLNAVVAVETTLSARALLRQLQRLEDEAGRIRAERWGARTLDLDLIVYGTQVIDDAEVRVPHPRAHERAFVLEPWLHVDPQAALPGHGPIAPLADIARGRGGVKWMALGWLDQDQAQ